MSGWVRFAGWGLVALLAQTPQFRSGIDLVRFDVVVLDKARHPITGLTAGDFRVTEEGKPLRIASFEAVTIPAGDTRTAPPPTATDTVTNRVDLPGRLVVIVMDRTISNGRPLVTARAVANAAVDAMGPNDRGAVLFATSLPVGRQQGLTADRNRLHGAIASLQMGATTDLRGGPNVGNSCAICTIEMLTGVVSSLAVADGYRKMILFIGENIAVSDLTVLEGGGTVRSASEKLMQTLDRANVTVHVIDPRELETTGTAADNTRPESAGLRMLRQGNLQVLPDYTGGRTLLAMNEPERMVPGVFAEDHTYYVLAVERDPARKDGKPHAIAIGVTKSDVTVLARKAYFDTGAGASAKRPGDPLEQAIANLLPQPALPLRMTLAPGATKNSSLDITLATPRSSAARADVLVSVFDEFAKPVGSERARVDLPARAGGDAEWQMHLDPKPGRYEVPAAVKIGDTIGSVTGYVDVPNPTSPSNPTSAPAAPRSDASAPARSAARSAAIEAILARAGAYVEQYGDPRGGLLLHELYRQDVQSSALGTRTLKSELLIVPDASEGWVQFRDVLSVDGKKVSDREDRLARLFSAPAEDPRGQARRIAEEGARYNLTGASVVVKRSLNQPLTALLYLRPLNQPRSQFTLDGAAGRDGQHLAFIEQQQPTIVGTTGNAGATGDFWIDPATGQVRRAALRVVSRASNVTVTAILRVRYEANAKTGLMLPVSMEEWYDARDPRGNLLDVIRGEATYSNPRQFKVTAEGAPKL